MKCIAPRIFSPTIKVYFLVVFSKEPFVTLVATFVTSGRGVTIVMNGESTGLRVNSILVY